MIIALSVTVFADPPSQYGPYPSTPTEYKYKTILQGVSGGNPFQWYVVSLVAPTIEPDTGGGLFKIRYYAYDYMQYHNLDESFVRYGDSSNDKVFLDTSFQVVYTNYDMYDYNRGVMIHAKDEDIYEIPSVEDCTIYTVGVGDTLNIQNSSTADQFFYFKATNATYEKIVSIGSEYPIINNYENLSSGEWEWMEPEANSNYNYWKIRQGTIEIGVPEDSPLVIRITRKVPTGGYDTIPSPDRGNYEDGIFGSISYGIDTLIYWVSYPFIAVGQLFVGLIDEIKLNLGWINDFTGLVGILFGWIPERFQGLLFIGASATVISFVIRVFRGS
jgi:hypothetical protein